MEKTDWSEDEIRIIEKIRDKTKFNIVDRIGSGGMGDVYKAMFKDNAYAVKILKSTTLNKTSDIYKDAIRRFNTEIATIEKIHSYEDRIDKDLRQYLNNIIKIFDSSLHHDFPIEFPAFYVMEYLPNEIAKLPELLKSEDEKTRQGAFKKSIEIIRDICGALCIIHDKKLGMPIYHRDVKDANIIGTLDRPVLTDFGLVKNMDVTGVTMTHQAIGSPHYMSPEQARGKPDSKELMKLGPEYEYVDHRTDIYSAGVVLYKWTSGRFPFDDEKLGTLFAKISNKNLEPPWLRDLDPNFNRNLETVILTAIAKDRNERYQSAYKFKEDLRAVLNNEKPDAKISFKRKFLRETWRKNKKAKIRTISSSAATFLAILGIAYQVISVDPAEVALNNLSTRFGSTKQIVENNPKKLDYLVEADMSVDNAKAESEKGYLKFGQEGFRTIGKELDEFDDGIEMKIASSLKNEISEANINDSLAQKFGNLGKYILKSKIEMLIKKGEIKPGQFPNYCVEKTKWDFDEGSRWNVGFWPHMLLMVYEKEPTQQNKENFMKWVKPLVDQDYSEKYNMNEAIYNAFCKGYDVFKDEKFKEIALKYSDIIIERLKENKNKHFALWKDKKELGEATVGVMNKLLLWSYEQTGDSRYFEGAKDVTSIVDNFIKPDSSSYWKMKFENGKYTPFYDEFSKKDLTYGRTHMKIAMGLNEYALRTGDLNALKKAEKLSDYFINNLENGLCKFYLEDKKLLDDTYSSIIGANVLIELSKIEKHLAESNPERAREMNARASKYNNTAMQIIQRITKDYLSLNAEENPLLKGCKHIGSFNGEASTFDADFHYIKSLEDIANEKLFSNKESEIAKEGTILSGFKEQNTGFMYDKTIIAAASHDSENIEAIFTIEGDNKSKIKENDDKIWEDNSAFVVIDSKKDSKPAYIFGMNTNGIKYDGIGDDNKENPEWKSDVNKFEKGWIAHFTIPYTKLGIEGDELDFNLFVMNKGKTYSWNYNNFTDVGDYKGKTQRLYTNMGKIILRK